MSDLINLKIVKDKCESRVKLKRRGCFSLSFTLWIFVVSHNDLEIKSEGFFAKWNVMYG